MYVHKNSIFGYQNAIFFNLYKKKNGLITLPLLLIRSVNILNDGGKLKPHYVLKI